jgi:hypothetical protein
MGPLAAADHLLGFAAPALFVGLLVAVLARFFWREARSRGWWVTVGVNCLCGSLALAGGLALFGVDGKMASYGALVAAVATSQWLLGRAWRG